MSEKPAQKAHWLPPVTGPGWRKVVGRVLWLLVLVAVGLIVWMHATDPFGDHGFSNAYTMMLGILLALLYILWFLAASGQRWWMKLAFLAAVAVFAFGFFALFRFDQVSGEFVPGFALKSSEKPDRLLDQPAARGGGVDLATTTADDFPQFLGPGRDLEIDHVRLDRDWQAHPPKLLWKKEIGAGWSGFSVVNGYALTMEQRGERELVTCYDLATGEVEWSHGIDARYEVTIAGTGPRATPTVDDGLVYTQGATGRLFALDGATGMPVWEKDLLAEFGMTPEQESQELPYGRSASPLVEGDLVVVPAGGPKASGPVSLVAYHKKTGEEVWRGGERQISCASPTAADLGGVRQILIVNESSATGHDAATGRVLWEYEREGSSNANANVSNAVAVAPNRVFLSKGYALGAALIELHPKADGTFDVEEIWQDSRVMRTKFTNVAVKDGYVYGLSDGILESIELATGERQWKGGRYKHGQILLVGDVLLVLSEAGEMLMVEATPERKNHVLGSFQALDGKTWNNFALYGSRLVVRNAGEAACYELPLAS